MQWISIVLGIAGVVASALFGVLAVVPAEPRGWVIGGAIAVGVVALLWLLIVSSPKIYEWRLRKVSEKSMTFKGSVGTKKRGHPARSVTTNMASR
jgi:hypothetical protein